VLAAQLSQVEAQLALSEEKLARTQLVAPFDGVVVSGDLSQMLGAPVERGKVLFELAPLGKYRVILQVDERDIAHVTSGQRGELALTGVTGANLAVHGQGRSRRLRRPRKGAISSRGGAARRHLGAHPAGMEGVGKISVGERRLLWIWTRNFVNWVRISFWTWMP
jgi:hypothetical protein